MGYGINIAYTIGYLLTLTLMFEIAVGLFLVCELSAAQSIGGGDGEMSNYADLSGIARWLLCFGGIACVSLVQWCHVVGVGLMWVLLTLHVWRGAAYKSWSGRLCGWLSGLLSMIVCIVVSVLGYIQCWGTLSYWGGVVIGSLLGVGGRLLLHGDVALGVGALGIIGCNGG